MIYLGVFMLAAFVSVYFYNKSQYMEIITSAGAGKARIVRKFVLCKTLPNGITGVMETRIMRETYIVQLLSIDGKNFFDAAWSAVEQ